MEEQTTSTVANIEVPAPPTEATKGQHRVFLFEASDLGKVLTECKARGLKFLSAKRTSPGLTADDFVQAQTDNGAGPKFLKRREQNEVVKLPAVVTYLVKTMEPQT
jgi:hypothetical protein